MTLTLIQSPPRTQLDMLALYAQGYSDHDIAFQTGYSHSTVRNYFQKLLIHYNAANRAHALAQALIAGDICVEELA